MKSKQWDKELRGIVVIVRHSFKLRPTRFRTPLRSLITLQCPFVFLLYWRGANNITETPTKHIPAPIQSYKSGVLLSIPHPHNTERTINTPP